MQAGFRFDPVEFLVPLLLRLGQWKHKMFGVICVFYESGRTLDSKLKYHTILIVKN